jgi:hypothetical protein
MQKDYRIVFTIEPLSCHFHYRCKAETKEEASQKARVEIQNAVNAVHSALKPFEMDPAWGIYSHLYLIEYQVGKGKHREDLKGSIGPIE